ncbi:TraB/GumN family protein [Cribrihabitans neustonicus]|uniref:TraB/GumN family protein n=1 Tax=Cribrihabitans neustonicus TaxID=1429085 RepID=UPI003B5C9572
MTRILLLLAFLLQASAGYAACRGADFRNQLTPAAEQRLAEEMAATPFAVGNHWVARKGTRTIHVIGTMHGGDARMGRVMRTLRPVLNAAGAIYLETSRAELERYNADPTRFAARFLLPRGEELRRLVSPLSWERFVVFARLSGTDLDLLNRMQPWAVSMFLIQSGCRPYGFGTRRGLDDRIADHARRKRIPLGALETVGDGLNALSALPLRDQAKMLDLELLVLHSDKPEDATPVEAYFDESVWSAFILAPWVNAQFTDMPAEEVARLWQVNNLYLLEMRNKRWLAPILAARHETIVVAVGAAHLPGRGGLLNLLQQRGFQLSRAPWQPSR